MKGGSVGTGPTGTLVVVVLLVVVVDVVVVLDDVVVGGVVVGGVVVGGAVAGGVVTGGAVAEGAVGAGASVVWVTCVIATTTSDSSPAEPPGARDDDWDPQAPSKSAARARAATDRAGRREAEKMIGMPVQSALLRTSCTFREPASTS